MEIEEVFRLLEKQSDDPKVLRVCKEVVNWERGEIDKPMPHYNVFLSKLIETLIPENDHD